MEKNTAKTLIDAIGQDCLVAELGLTERNIRHFRSSGKIAAQWYRPIKSLAENAGVFCPMDAFSFKSLRGKSGSRNQHSTK